jgi:hypothetical protein
MKTKLIVSEFAACVALTLMMGCNKEPATTQSSPAQKAEGVASEVKSEASKAADTVKSEASKAADTVKATAQQVTQGASTQANAAEQQAQGLIDKVKSLIADQKYQDALSSLNQLANANLTAEQQKLVADLKTQIQNALSKASVTDAASALGVKK